MTSRVALVTASSAGLGAACVKALAPHFRVVVNYHSRPQKAEEVIKEATAIPPLYKHDASSGDRFVALQADVADRTSVQQLVQQTVDRMGRLDVVVSNAGWTRITDFMNLDDQVAEDDWDRCFNVNVKAHLWLLYAAKPHLEANPDKGSFVTVASLAGVRPSGSSVPYAVSKAAAIYLTRCLALVCGKSGVRCNSVSPGLLLTEWGQRFPEDKIEATKNKAVLGRLAEIDDVAAQVATLALSRSITGQNVVIDGGIAL
ncbi:hypothetical protein SEUCBS139899_008070 [Sporothrix eucalyptigena]|uniref:Uncharacterized protein n=1 Tax=Sporothrix eucalyptigena TaxID=1812306 RepID=A0ABP0CCW0_9PEZI